MTTQFWFWIGFIIFILAMLTLDLGVFQRRAHEIKPKEALLWTGFWVSLALIFCVVVYYFKGAKSTVDFLTAYLVEYSLSIDNLFVFLVIFSYFRVPAVFEHKILFWGILGAMIARILFIMAGITLVQKLEWTIYLFGAFLVYLGIKMLFQEPEDIEPEHNPALKLFRRFMPISKDYQAGHFFIRENGKLLATPLMVVLIAISTTDVVFATDSVPAVISITRDLFIAYTSNIFAILGLRSLFFALSGLMRMFDYLSHGISVILTFVGVKMLISHWLEIPSWITLVVIVAILGLSIIISLVKPPKYPKPENTETGQKES